MVWLKRYGAWIGSGGAFLFILLTGGFARAWVQHTKAQFQTGTLNHLQVTWPSGEDDGYVSLPLPIYNGSFDEQDNALGGWTIESDGDGSHTVEVVSGGGRSHVLHLYTAYGTQTTRTRLSQTITQGLDFLRRFNVEVYPLSSEISGSIYIVVHVFAYDQNDNSLIQGNWITYLLDGEYVSTPHDWRAQTVRDRWNIYRFDLKSDIEEELLPGYTWSDVAKVKILLSVEATALNATCGAYFDAIWAAPFIDDNFNDNSVDLSKWRVYENIYQVAEQGQQIRFWGYDASNTLYSSIDREGDTVHTASCEAAARMRHLYMENEDGQKLVFGFYSPNSGKYLVLEAHRTANNSGYYNVEYYDGTAWYSTQIGTYNFLSMNRFYTWRLLYDAPAQRFEAWIDGKMVGRVENFSMTDYYPYVAVLDADNDPTDSIDCQMDDFMFFDLSQGGWSRRYVIQDTGTYVTAPQDLGYPVDFLRLRWAGSVPTGTSLRMQFRSGSTQVALQNAPWCGPQGPGTYFTTSGQPFSPFHDGDRWFQVRAFFVSNDSLQTPTLDSLIVEYDSLAVIQGDSGWAELGNGIASVIQYDANGQRSVVARFKNPSGQGNPPQMMAVVHASPPNGILGTIERWWRLGFSGTFDSVALTFFYQNADVPPGLDEADLQLWRRPSSSVPWSLINVESLDTLYNWAYQLQLTDLSEWTLGPPSATGATEQGRSLPQTPYIQIIPGEIRLQFQVNQKTRVLAQIYDVTGRKVATMLNRTMDPGRYEIVREMPRHMPKGVYFLILQIGHARVLSKLSVY